MSHLLDVNFLLACGWKLKLHLPPTPSPMHISLNSLASTA